MHVRFLMHVKKVNCDDRKFPTTMILFPPIGKTSDNSRCMREGFDIKPTAREHGVYPHQVEERGWNSRQYSKYLLKFQHLQSPDECDIYQHMKLFYQFLRSSVRVM